MRHALTLAAMTAALLSTTAMAADLPRREPPPVFVPVPVFSWTGFYFGANAGYAITDTQSITTRGNNGPGAGPLLPPNFTNTVNNVALLRRTPSIRSEQDGFSGGGQIGYNFQLRPGGGFVFGIEADAQFTDLESATSYLSPGFNDPSTFRQSLDYLGTVRGRLGYAVDRFMVYGTGGFAYGDVNYSAQFFSNNVAAGNPLAYQGSYRGTETGYAYGGGIEYALPTDSFLNFFRSNAVTLKIEYLRYDLGRRNVLVDSINPATGTQFIAAANGSYTTRFSSEGNLVRAGLNFKFGGY